MGSLNQGHWYSQSLKKLISVNKQDIKLLGLCNAKNISPCTSLKLNKNWLSPVLLMIKVTGSKLSIINIHNSFFLLEDKGYNNINLDVTICTPNIPVIAYPTNHIVIEFGCFQFYYCHL